ncbi:MAG: SufD family Fe-S cluster assembly protein [Patescibacteria group bacterium]
MAEEIIIAQKESKTIVKTVSSVEIPKEVIFTIEEEAKAEVRMIFDQPEDKCLKLKFLLKGKESELQFRGLIIANNNNMPNIDIEVFHLAKNTTANVVWRGIVTDEARENWRGMISITPQSPGTNSWLEIKTLLLSSGARATAVPAMEIKANKVKASHAAVISKIDQEQLFYMLTRGLDKTQAEKLLVKGFIEPVMPVATDVSKLVEPVLTKLFT